MEREDTEQSHSRELPIALAVGGLASTAFFTTSLIADQIVGKFQEVASYPCAAASAGVCLYGLRQLVARRR